MENDNPRVPHLTSTPQLTKSQDGAVIHISGIIRCLWKRVTSKNRPWAFLILQDHAGKVEVAVYPDAYPRCIQGLMVGVRVTITGELRFHWDDPEHTPHIYADRIIPSYGRTQTAQPTANAQ